MNHLAPLHLVDPRTLRTYCGSIYVASPSFGPTRLCASCKTRKDIHESQGEGNHVHRNRVGTDARGGGTQTVAVAD